ncbi:50S ribosomal protein L29 [Acetobacterium wieringae]|jgi:large subunit ribosomal protein L29|uniref:Large ribosomal subunit protein uL29 n=1 Tax=Acetobacterium wieringae TaxID=52694 RepID=A0A1F2PLI4_9FIRM|nr:MULTISPECIES: 50S ribosomal protein L29 [Acetobacterium]MEA4806629.1 50S ribosomal protein L29 [Acetobacterium wieringae]OFV71825.1 50S ribosomal protein L29 [Acetobacterium wieringae]OXS24728.1 MAG: 50S ribosomal protein L29 [Acetobacterium sp. MES1]TYC85650.1 50S ribosomal protein L29 [Acetobacterium wieringae]URN85030.1 50S ribosomal protein L29 [Acetobacterium wieringae]
MKPSELRELTTIELEAKLGDLKEELFNLRFQHATGQLENPMRIKEVKKTYARIKTIIQERVMKSDEA